jgi:hypothetical protein
MPKKSGPEVEESRLKQKIASRAKTDSPDHHSVRALRKRLKRIQRKRRAQSARKAQAAGKPSEGNAGAAASA